MCNKSPKYSSITQKYILWVRSSAKTQWVGLSLLYNVWDLSCKLKHLGMSGVSDNWRSVSSGGFFTNMSDACAAITWRWAQMRLLTVIPPPSSMWLRFFKAAGGILRGSIPKRKNEDSKRLKQDCKTSSYLALESMLHHFFHHFFYCYNWVRKAIPDARGRWFEFTTWWGSGRVTWQKDLCDCWYWCSHFWTNWSCYRDHVTYRIIRSVLG